MTTETLKKLIEYEFERVSTISEFKQEILRLIDLYESERLPDYTRPVIGVPNQYDWDGVPDKVPYGTLCPCNPANGGSGICGCTLGNQMVDNPKKYGQPKTNFSQSSGTAAYNSIHNFVESNGGDKNFCKMCGIHRNEHITITLT